MRTVLILLALSLGHHAEEATCEPVGDGCGIPWLACDGAALIGETFALEAPGVPGAPMLLVVGPVAAEPGLLASPVACIPPGCATHVAPLGLFVEPVGAGALATFPLAVPAEPALVGTSLGAQAASPSPTGTCFYLSPGVRVTFGAE